jgi:hypothetical protein
MKKKFRKFWKNSEKGGKIQKNSIDALNSKIIEKNAGNFRKF